MNEGFIQTKSGDIIVFDENGTPRQIENNNSLDNLNEKFTQENIIEKIEKRIKELEKELEGAPSPDEVNNKKYIPIYVIIITIIILISPLLNWLIYYTLYGGINAFDIIVDTIFGPLNQALASSFPIATLLPFVGLILELSHYTEHKRNIKSFNANMAELETLRRIYPEEKEKLEIINLKKEPNPPKIEFGYYQVNDWRAVESLNDYLTLYRNLGWDLSKFYEAYQNGTLETLLQQKGYRLSYQEKEKLINYVKEKGPILAKRKNHRRKGRKQVE